MASNDVFANLRQEMVAMKEEQHRVKEERQKRIPELKDQSHQILAQANQFMTDAHAANAGLKAHVSQFRAEVNRMVGVFAKVSHERAASWKQTLKAVRGRKPSRAHPDTPGHRG